MPAYLEEHLQAKTGVPNGQFLRVGLISNMPDGAAEATERQFVTLLDRAAGDLNVSISFYEIGELRRSESGRSGASRRYLPLENLLDQNINGLIVTGAEPRTEHLTGEAYWKSLTRVIDWAENHTLSTVWSCLAAHAAVLHLDGIQRHRLEVKRFGLFEFSRSSSHPLAASVSPVVQIPHSRWNDLKPGELQEAGYEILTQSCHGVDMFVKQRKSLFVFFQGHPEYEPDTLLLEYRRDVGRYLRRERDTYPSQPHGYFDSETTAELDALRARCLTDRRKDLLADFPLASAGRKGTTGAWQPVAVRLYRNWLRCLCAQKKRASTYRTLADPAGDSACVLKSANA